MQKLIFDIETIGENFDNLDKTTQDNLTRWAKKNAKNQEELSQEVETIKNEMALSPLTGEIVTIGLLDTEEDRGAIYYQNKGEAESKEEEGIKYKSYSEKEMLKKFWEIAKQTNQFISFNGRSFDVPFLIIRSAIHGIRPSVNLMPYRYAKHYETNHLDLLDHLSFLGTVRRKGNLHLWCRIFNIKSPKASGVSGSEVGELFKQKRYLDIAKYNTDDLLQQKNYTRNGKNIWHSDL